MQVQFVAIFTHQFQLLVTECNYPKSFMVWIALHGVMFLFLFSDFYKVKYLKKRIVKSANTGICMVGKQSEGEWTVFLMIYCCFQPVLEDDQNANETVKKATLNNSYIKSEYTDSYKACYSNGSTKGFVSRSIVKHDSKKIE